MTESGWAILLQHVCLASKSSWSTILSDFWDGKKNSKAVGMDSIAVTIAKSAHTKFRIRSHTSVQWLPHNRAQQIKLQLWKQKQYVSITMALGWSQGLLLGVKYFTEVQNHGNAAGQFADGSGLSALHLIAQCRHSLRNLPSPYLKSFKFTSLNIAGSYRHLVIST